MVKVYLNKKFNHHYCCCHYYRHCCFHPILRIWESVYWWSVCISVNLLWDFLHIPVIGQRVLAIIYLLLSPKQHSFICLYICISGVTAGTNRQVHLEKWTRLPKNKTNKWIHRNMQVNSSKISNDRLHWEDYYPKKLDIWCSQIIHIPSRGPRWGLSLSLGGFCIQYSSPVTVTQKRGEDKEWDLKCLILKKQTKTVSVITAACLCEHPFSFLHPPAGCPSHSL